VTVDGAPAGRVIDAHLHVWDRSRSGYPWLTPELGALFRDFGPEEAGAELAAAGIDAAVLVQADDTLADTRYLLEIAGRHDFVAAVVGWVPIDDAATTRAALAEFADAPRLRGIRHLLNDDPREGLLDRPEVRASLTALAEHGLAFDVHDAWPRHLAAAGRLAEAVPELTIVVDHLGKPPVAPAEIPAWEAELREVARRPNTFAKLSGLHRPGMPFTETALRPLLDLALDAFGADRLMYGGDWPISVPYGGYPPTWAVLRALIGRLAPSERDAVLAGTAERVYGLGAHEGVHPC
jgi:L-fuconolactonase